MGTPTLTVDSVDARLCFIDRPPANGGVLVMMIYVVPVEEEKNITKVTVNSPVLLILAC